MLAEAHAHGTGRFYDTDALLRGEDPLWEVERAALVRAAMLFTLIAAKPA